MSSEVELIATFDTPQTAKSGAELLNRWFTWIVEEDSESNDDIESLFDDFGISLDDFYLERDVDTDWSETPEVYCEDNKIIICIDSKSGVDTVQSLLEEMGAYDVTSASDDDN